MSAASTPNDNTRLPQFGSDEHVERISRRLSKNLAFRRQLQAFARLGVEAHRIRARELAS